MVPHVSLCLWCVLTPACKKTYKYQNMLCVRVCVCGYSMVHTHHTQTHTHRLQSAQSQWSARSHRYKSQTCTHKLHHTHTHTQSFSSRCPRPHLRTHTPAPSLRGQELKPPVIRTNPCLPVSLRGWVPVTLTTWNYNPNGMSGVSSVSKRTMRIYFLLWTCPLRDLPQKQEVTWWLAFLQPN